MKDPNEKNSRDWIEEYSYQKKLNQKDPNYDFEEYEYQKQLNYLNYVSSLSYKAKTFWNLDFVDFFIPKLLVERLDNAFRRDMDQARKKLNTYNRLYATKRRFYTTQLTFHDSDLKACMVIYRRSSLAHFKRLVILQNKLVPKNYNQSPEIIDCIRSKYENEWLSFIIAYETSVTKAEFKNDDPKFRFRRFIYNTNKFLTNSLKLVNRLLIRLKKFFK